MPEKIVQLNEKVIRGQLQEMGMRQHRGKPQRASPGDCVAVTWMGLNRWLATMLETVRESIP